MEQLPTMRQFQLVGFTICSLSWVQPVIQVFSYLNFALLIALMTKLVIRVRLSRHHAASEASQGPIDLQLRSNSLSSLTCICAFTVFHLNNSLHDSSTIALLPVFNMPYTKLNWLFLPVLNVPVVLCMVGIEKLKLPVMYNINEMTG